MKAYKFTTKSGEAYKVRFYDSGIYTVFDKNGEHEMGLWWRSKGCGYEGKEFEKGNVHFEYSLMDLAYRLLRAFMYRR